MHEVTWITRRRIAVSIYSAVKSFSLRTVRTDELSQDWDRESCKLIIHHSRMKSRDLMSSLKVQRPGQKTAKPVGKEVGQSQDNV